MVVESSQLIAHSLTLDLATDLVNAGRVADLQQELAQPGSDLWQGQGRGHLLTSVGFTNQEPHRQQRQGHVVMPALPGAHLILIHADFALASFKPTVCPSNEFANMLSYQGFLTSIQVW